MKQVIIEDAVRNVTRSRLFNHIRSTEVNRFVKFSRPRQVDALALYKSQNFMYDLKTKPNWSQYASQFTMGQINDFYTDIKQFATTKFVAPLNDMHADYFKRKFKHIRGYLDPKIVYNAFQEYGHNSGIWGSNEAKLYEMGISYYLNDLNFKSLENLERFPANKQFYEWFDEKQDERWPKLLEMYPYLSTLNLTSSSGYPHWNEQNIGYVLENMHASYEMLINPEHSINTAYCRTQGGTSVTDEVNKLVSRLQELVNWKNRYVDGVPFHVKDTQAFVTYLFQESKPIWTPYFKTGVEVNTRIMNDIALAVNKGYFYYASDIEECDQSHTNVNLDRIYYQFQLKLAKLVMEINWLLSFFKAGFKFLKNPKVLWNFRQMQHNNYPEQRTFSLSGHPHIPLFQTLSVLVSHVLGTLAAIDKLNDVQGEHLKDKIEENIIDVLCQIDDIFMVVDLNGQDPEEFKKRLSEFMLKHYGMKTNHTKYLDAALGFTMLLKVVVGFLYPEGEALLCVDGTQDILAFLGYIPTKTKGMFDKERGSKDDGTPLLYLDLDDLDSNDMKKLVNVNHKYVDPKTGKVLYGAKKALQQLYGSLQSFGPKMPYELLQIVQWHFNKKKVWNELILLSKMKTTRILARDWGFQDHELVMKAVLDLGDPHQFRKN
jgi:hypothetical protein